MFNNNFIGSLLGSAVTYGLNQMFSPTTQWNNQIADLQKQMNSNLAQQMSMINQGTLGFGGMQGFGGMMPSMPMFGGIGSFWNAGTMPGMPGIGSVATAGTANAVSASPYTGEIAANLSATTQSTSQLVDGLVDTSVNSYESKTDIRLKSEYIEKLKEDFKDIPAETLDLLKQNGTKIKIIMPGTSLADVGILETMDKTSAVAEQDKIINALNEVKSANGFKNIDPSVLKTNLELPISTYKPTEKPITQEIKGVDRFKTQFLDELANVYSEGKNLTPEQIKEFKDNMSETHNDDALTKGWTDTLKKKKDEIASTDPAQAARLNKMLALEDMMALAKKAPVQDKGKYYKPEDYAVINSWDNGTVESMYGRNENVMYLKADIIGKEVGSGDGGKISVHELGHAVADVVRDKTPNFNSAFGGYLKQNYNAAAKADEDPSQINASGKNEFISAYSSYSQDEYLAETFAAYFYPPKASILKENDPNQYNLIASLMKELGKGKQYAMGMAAKSA